MANKKVCGKCGGMFSSRGFAMHEAFCKGEKKEDHKNVDSKSSIEICHSCKSNDIHNLDELLKSGKPKLITVGNVAINKGYTHFCNDCGEVLK